MSCQLCSGRSSVEAAERIPAFATAMSRRPNASTPYDTAASRAEWSRTSVWLAMILRPRPSTCLTVSPRSASLASAYGTESIESQRSTAMMSAPSEASRTACARPCSRAAPVMKATLPSTRPVMTCSLVGWVGAASVLVGEPGVDGEGRPGDVAAVLGDEVEDRVGDVVDRDEPDRQRVG